MTPLRQRMLEELQRRNYSPSTFRGYILAVRQFAEYFGKSPEKLGAEEVRRFQLHLLNEKKLKPRTVQMRMAALRFLYKKTLKRRDIEFDDLPFPKVPKKLPVVLSPEEVARLIEAASDLTHRTILMLLYATGMRRAEVPLLKVSDIDSERMIIHIRQGKGPRDRDVPMSPKLLEALREYYRRKRPKTYLFSSRMRSWAGTSTLPMLPPPRDVVACRVDLRDVCLRPSQRAAIPRRACWRFLAGALRIGEIRPDVCRCKRCRGNQRTLKELPARLATQENLRIFHNYYRNELG